MAKQITTTTTTTVTVVDDTPPARQAEEGLSPVTLLLIGIVCAGFLSGALRGGGEQDVQINNFNSNDGAEINVRN